MANLGVNYANAILKWGDVYRKSLAIKPVPPPPAPNQMSISIPKFVIEEFLRGNPTSPAGSEQFTEQTNRYGTR